MQQWPDDYSQVQVTKSERINQRIEEQRKRLRERRKLEEISQECHMLADLELRRVQLWMEQNI